MHVRYFDNRGRDRSRSLGSLLAASENLPNALRTLLLWRFAARLAKHVSAVDGTPGFIHWGKGIGRIGNGRLELTGSFAIADNVRFEITDPASVTIADGVRLDAGAMLYAYQGRIEFGPRVYIGPYAFLQSEGTLRVGRDTMIGPRVNVLAYTRTALRDVLPYAQQPITSKGISIGANVWIGAGATILDGVTIGDDAIIGAGSLVTKNVEAATVVIGSPARFLRQVDRKIGVIAESVDSNVAEV